VFNCHVKPLSIKQGEKSELPLSIILPYDGKSKMGDVTIIFHADLLQFNILSASILKSEKNELHIDYIDGWVTWPGSGHSCLIFKQYRM
jgi:hypothetical protein